MRTLKAWELEEGKKYRTVSRETMFDGECVFRLDEGEVVFDNNGVAFNVLEYRTFAELKEFDFVEMQEPLIIQELLNKGYMYASLTPDIIETLIDDVNGITQELDDDRECTIRLLKSLEEQSDIIHYIVSKVSCHLTFYGTKALLTEKCWIGDDGLRLD